MARFALILALLAPWAASQAGPPPPLRLDESTFRPWLIRVLPAPRDVHFQRIPWRIRLRDGIEDATRERKPVLLWAMDGHPLGPT